ncbi:putative ankyrin repeat protein RF_0381 [Patella vulgata]|uniref:putative ankyrin repeat protein RF_0381 n=1 Tax=Patella vulgata TaxID=6465 RepID=UPI0024A92333|nr:putative ankyrin repeat protein RF_0381 [Patella vulgata]XP_050389577.2 putative ankyrin repeat protein RF_0381 [Patella vulgata]
MGTPPPTLETYKEPGSMPDLRTIDWDEEEGKRLWSRLKQSKNDGNFPTILDTLSSQEQAVAILTGVDKGYFKTVIDLIDHGSDVHCIDTKYRGVLHYLLTNYRFLGQTRHDLFFKCLTTIVGAGGNVNHVDSDKDVPILMAARHGLIDVVIYLIDHGADIHCVDKNQKNTLLCLFGYFKTQKDRRFLSLLLECVIKLVQAGIDVNYAYATTDPPLFIAAKEGWLDIMMCLIDHGANMESDAFLERNILHLVLRSLCCGCDEKYIDIVKTLINRGIDVNQADKKMSNTPLFGMANRRSPLHKEKDEMVKLKYKLINMLTEGGCNLNHQNRLLTTPIMFFIKEQADIRVIYYLILNGADINLTDKNSNTAISYCVQYHFLDCFNIFKLLVHFGSDLMSTKNGIKLFHEILKCKRLDVFNYYIGRQLIIIGATSVGETMLHLLARVNFDYSSKAFKWLFNSELDINHRCSKTNTPSMIAAILLNSKYLELLTPHPKIKINAQNNKGHTALHLCVIGFTMLKDGLNKRQVNDVVQKYCRQIYPIYMECVDILLAAGIDVNLQDNSGRTVLMFAAMKNDRVLVKKLLKAGAMVNVFDNLGRSALQYLDFDKSVFDLTCFKLIMSNGDHKILDLPCINGNTIIQTAVCFPLFWEPMMVVSFIRYLVAQNCCLQTLVTSSVESSLKLISLDELNHQVRDDISQLLYLSGAHREEIVTTLNFDVEDTQEDQDESLYSHHKKTFNLFCNNVSLKSICRRVIRQTIGLIIHQAHKNLELPLELNEFLLLKDVLHSKYYDLYLFDGGYDEYDDVDDFDSYDIDKDKDDDYSEYSYQYFALYNIYVLKEKCKKLKKFPNDQSLLPWILRHR